MQIRANQSYHQSDSIKTSMHDDEKTELFSNTGKIVGSGNSGAKKEDGGVAAMEVDEEDGEVTTKENDGDTEMKDAEKIDGNDTIENADKTEASNSQDMLVDDDGGGAAHVATANGNSNNRSDDATKSSDPSQQSSGTAIIPNKTKDNLPSSGSTKTENKENGSEPAPPVMKGTLSIDINGQQRRHLIRGMWNFENSSESAPQRFELQRTLAPNEDEKTLPLDGEFHGSFSLTYVSTSTKGKRKERSRVISETGVKIKFTKKDVDEYNMEGRGTNQFGAFRIFGSAKSTADPNDPTMSIVFRKVYEPAPEIDGNGTKKRSNGTGVTDAAPLPDPSESYQSGVVCLRGKLSREDAHELGATNAVHRISGLWASGLDFIVSDPENANGLCNRFDYEHKSAVPSSQFPVSGKYSGGFDILDSDGSRKRINERDVTLKFKKNNAGYHNVDGKGSNVFGKYTITGTFTTDNVLTIFRHFQQRKFKAPRPPTQAPTVANPSAPLPPLPSAAANADAKLKLQDITIPDGDDDDQVEPPTTGNYSAVSRGVLRVNDDGSHSCQGKWATTRELYNTGQTLPMTFRLESHHATEAQGNSKSNFPLDSAMYKGSFQIKKGAKSQAIVDQQIVMKFRKNKQGSYNVHGKGFNSIGEFNLIGSLVFQGTSAGQVELYRVYPADKLVSPPVGGGTAVSTVKSTESLASMAVAGVPRGPAQQGLTRRGSSRTVKAPLWLEEDDPNAQISRTLDKCSQILKYLRDKDVEFGAFFGQPVDPIAMRIPTYFQVVKEPMDLKTIARKMEAGTVSSPEEFKRLVSLVFENAISFNVDPNHSVHQAARRLLVLFNQKYRDVERSVDTIRRTHGVEVDFEKGKPGKPGNKRGRADDPPRSQKRLRLDEAQRMAAANASAITAIVAAAPVASTTTVTRSEFNMLLNLIQQIQHQVVETHKAVAELSPDNPNEKPKAAPAATAAAKRPSATPQKKAAPAAKERPQKKAPRRTNIAPIPERAEPVVAPDDTKELTADEQMFIMETINDLPQEHLFGVMQIIREAGSLDADEEEIDMDIDQLNVPTQRKLLRHVLQFVKKPKGQKKQAKKPKQQPAKKTTKSAPSVNKADPPKKVEKKEKSFLAFGGESESEEEEEKAAPGAAPVSTSNDFKLGDALELQEDEEDMEDEIVANWNFPNATENSDEKKESAEDENDWGAAAREQAAALKARDADRKAREEKKKADAEQASKERLADAAARGEEIKAQRAEEQAREASLLEEKEREAEAAREAAKQIAKEQLDSVEQTVDLDAQRDIMKQYEFTDTGGASPSSDFGF